MPSFLFEKSCRQVNGMSWERAAGQSRGSGPGRKVQVLGVFQEKIHRTPSCVFDVDGCLKHVFFFPKKNWLLNVVCQQKYVCFLLCCFIIELSSWCLPAGPAALNYCRWDMIFSVISQAAISNYVPDSTDLNSETGHLHQFLSNRPRSRNFHANPWKWPFQTV